MYIFFVGGGPPAPGGDYEDPVTEGIEDILGKENVSLIGVQTTTVIDSFDTEEGVLYVEFFNV